MTTLTVLLLVLAVASLAAITGTVVALVRDGYRPVPVRTNARARVQRFLA